MNKLISDLLHRNANASVVFPDKKKAIRFIDELVDVLYIHSAKAYASEAALEKEFAELGLVFNKLLNGYQISSDEENNWLAFTRILPELYEKGIKDAEAIFSSDPAANSLEEVTHTYPGFYAIAIHRISHFLWQNEIKTLARIFSEHVHSKTGIDIHPGAEIGEGFAIDHGTGIVLGETAVIGKNVKIYQGVTLGAFSVSKENGKSKRHPSIEDDVVIYSNATILGGTTIVGKGSIIGGNVWLTHSVPSNSVVFHEIDIKVKDNNPFSEPINFII